MATDGVLGLNRDEIDQKAIKHVPGLGKRTVKTAVAVGICLLLGALVGYEAPFYASIAAVMSMRATPAQSIEYGKERLIGTVVGGAVALLVVFILQKMPFLGTSYLLILLISAAILLGLFICNLLKQKDAACSICCVVILAILLIHPGGRDSYLYILSRTIETAIGIAIAVAVNRLI